MEVPKKSMSAELADGRRYQRLRISSGSSLNRAASPATASSVSFEAFWVALWSGRKPAIRNTCRTFRTIVF
jgi:hypothetical protein